MNGDEEYFTLLAEELAREFPREQAVPDGDATRRDAKRPAQFCVLCQAPLEGLEYGVSNLCLPCIAIPLEEDDPLKP